MEINIKHKYNIIIYERYKDLRICANKEANELNNNDLCKIFEYYSCIKLTEEYKTKFYEYDDISPDFKELNQMTEKDTGIDCCNLIDTIVQCKLRKDTLSWKECSTFFGSQNLYNEELNETIIRWKNLIITRNNDCKLSSNLQDKHRLFIDKPYNRDELINYCEDLLVSNYISLEQESQIIPIVNDMKEKEKKQVKTKQNNNIHIIKKKSIFV